MKIAFFDLDKTIIKKDSIVPFMFFYLKKNPKSFIYYIRLIPYFILFLFKIIDNSKIKYEIAHIFKNIPIEFGYSIGEEFANTVVPSLYYNDAIKEINKLKEEGYKLIMVTASFEIYAKFIGKNLGFDRVMGTELWIFRDKYTGFMYGKNCYNEAKRHRLFTEGIFKKDISQNIVYSDSISDLPFFAFAAKKVCVNPDKKLREYAINNKEKNFSIVEWK